MIQMNRMIINEVKYLVIIYKKLGLTDPENSFFSHQSISQRAEQTSLEKQLDPNRTQRVYLLVEGGGGGW